MPYRITGEVYSSLPDNLLAKLYGFLILKHLLRIASHATNDGKTGVRQFEMHPKRAENFLFRQKMLSFA